MSGIEEHTAEPVDMDVASNEEDDSDAMSSGIDSSTEGTGVRKRHHTEKGWQYHKELIEKMLKKSKRRLQNQHYAMNVLFEQAASQEIIGSESFTLDKLFNEFLEHLAKKREFIGPDEDSKNLDELADNFDEQMYAVKRRVSDIQQQSGDMLMLEDQHHISVSQVSTSSKSSRSTIRCQARVADLEAERLALLEMQDAEIKSEFVRSEEERKAALEITRARQQADLFRMEEEIANVKAMEEVYRDEEQKREIQDDNHSKASKSSRVSSHSSIAKRAKLAGLEAEMDAKKKTQEAELLVEQLKATTEAKLHKSIQDADRKIKLLELEKRIAKEKAIKDALKKNAETKLIPLNTKPVSEALSDSHSKASHATSSSRGTRAELKILKAQLDEQDRIHRAERDIKNRELEEIMAKVDSSRHIGMQDNLSNTSRVSHTSNTLSRVKQEEINKLKAQLIEPKSRHQQEIHSKQLELEAIRSKIDSSNETRKLKSFETKRKMDGRSMYTDTKLCEEKVEQGASVAECKGDDHQFTQELITHLSKMISLQAAPDVEIDTFSGDLLEYTYFITNFKEVVESSIGSQTGRLNRLIKYTSGEAKELIKHCIHESPSNCYDKAIALLDKEYGNRYKISCAYMEELRTWPQLKQNDSNAYKKCYRFLLKCLTLQKRGELDILNSPISIRQIQLKLPASQQDKWSKIVETTRRKNHREANFEDFVKFMDFESSVNSDPVYSRHGAIEKKTINVNNTVIKSETDESGIKNTDKKKKDNVNFVKCIVCGQAHDLDSCEAFIEKNVDEKKDILYEHQLCYACYGKGHNAVGCTNRKRCTICGKLHPTSMHIKSLSTGFVQASIVAMSIVPVIISHKDCPDKEVKAYAIIDNCSQGTFATENILLHDLGLSGRQTSVTLETANNIDTFQTTVVEDLVIRCTEEHKERYPDSPEIKLPSTYTRPTLPAGTRDIASKENALLWNHLKSIVDQMPSVDEQLPIGLLVGQDCPRAQEPYQIVRGEGNAPYAVRNALGWCIMGPVNVKEQGNPSKKCNLTRLQFPSTDIAQNKPSGVFFSETESLKDNQVKDCLNQMWMTEFIENEPEDHALSQEDRLFMKMMTDQVTIKDGHYELPLPFRQDNPQMPESRQQALARLASIKRKLQTDKAFYEDYCAFMKNIIDKGYASLCTDNEASWYIPHFGVYHPTKNKIRVVFDCSAKNQGVSLNGKLLQGPDLTNSLIGLLIRFRLERVAVMADIESMYYQVKVPESQHQFIRFIWWPDGDLSKDHQDYEMNVHLFGALSSPSCANFALKQTAIDNKSTYGEEVAGMLIRDFYVDDLLKSFKNDEDAIKLIKGSQSMCSAGGFILTKVISNSRAVIESLPASKISKSMENLDIIEPSWPIERALGVTWCIESDAFCFRINLTDVPLTRRGILSSISSIYDPLGLVAPFLLKGRKVLQKITAETSRWDDEVKQEHIQEWDNWRRGLPALSTLNIDRCYKPHDFGESIEASLHCFSDAAMLGYGVALYLRQVNKFGKIHVSLVLGKSRVSPLKPITIPRLELTAATVSSKVAKMVRRQINIESLDEFYWIDSQIVLGYITNEARRFRIFVANRVQLINENTDKEKWRYIETHNNPSDPASRGITMTDECGVEKWFKGPDFLWKESEDWKCTTMKVSVDCNDPEIKTSKCTNIIRTNQDGCLLETILERHSDWNKMKRILGNVILFVEKCRKRTAHDLSVEHIEKAGRLLIKLAQQKSFKTEIKDINKIQNKLPKCLYKLDPFKDDEGILRVGGRLKNSEQPDQIKFPIILPKDGLVTQRIIEWYHKKIGHAGRTTTVNELRSNGYWVISMTSKVKSLIHSCFRCRYLRGRLGEQKMANLPLDRTAEVTPFAHSGVDMFGPFNVKEGRKVHTRFCAIFTCFSSRAIHLETTNKLDTDSFILALRRFVATRGKVRTIRSDNGRNFVGTNNEFKKALKELDDTKIAMYLQAEACDWIKWDFNTPNASHMGGVWERQIRTVRSILTALLKSHDQVLNDESFNTLIKEVECIVNSRPLSVEDANDPNSQPVTPNHLLTLKTKAVLPPPGVFQKQCVYCRKRWRIVQHLANQFWCRWRKEYLANLQSRQKWTKEVRNFSVGDIVLVKDSDLFGARNNWPLARIIKVFPDKDGLVRSVRLHIATRDPKGKVTVLNRPITKLVFLEGAET